MYQDKSKYAFVRELAEISYILSTPLDFNKLFKDGYIKKIGDTFYLISNQTLPIELMLKISVLDETSNGVKLTFDGNDEELLPTMK